MIWIKFSTFRIIFKNPLVLFAEAVNPQDGFVELVASGNRRLQVRPLNLPQPSSPNREQFQCTRDIVAQMRLNVKEVFEIRSRTCSPEGSETVFLFEFWISS